MTCKNKLFLDYTRCLTRFIAQPPALPDNYTAADFVSFMRKETYLYSPRYAKNRVIIHGQDRLLDVAAHSGALLTPVHYGSFFLSGGAVVQQLKLPYTAIVTGRNIAPAAEEQLFWTGVHQRSACLYQHPLFYTGISSPKSLINYLGKPGNLLCAMLDVREQGQTPQEYVFNFLGSQIYLHTGPARLAYLAKVPMLPMTIQYNRFERRHHLYFGEPVYPCKDHRAVTQSILSSLEHDIADQPQQWFYDFLSAFTLPHNPGAL
jgi:lauroyl/myristoyl acyltransferase